MKVPGVLLAAGKSARMGRNKLLLPFGEHTVIEESLGQLVDSGVDEVIVVTGFQAKRIKRLIESRYENIKIIYNEHYSHGRSASIKCAVKNADRDCDALLFMVADKPSVESGLIKRALDEFKRRSPSILYVDTPGGRGHPVIFSKSVFGDLLNLEGEPAGNTIFEKYRDETVIFPDKDHQIDIDTIEDYNEIVGETPR